MRTTFAGYVIFFLVLAFSLGINLGMHLLDTLGMGESYLLLSLIAVVMAGLLVNRKVFFHRAPSVWRAKPFRFDSYL